MTKSLNYCDLNSKIVLPICHTIAMLWVWWLIRLVVRGQDHQGLGSATALLQNETSEGEGKHRVKSERSAKTNTERIRKFPKNHVYETGVESNNCTFLFAVCRAAKPGCCRWLYFCDFLHLIFADACRTARRTRFRLGLSAKVGSTCNRL